MDNSVLGHLTDSIFYRRGSAQSHQHTIVELMAWLLSMTSAQERALLTSKGRFQPRHRSWYKQMYKYVLRSKCSGGFMMYICPGGSMRSMPTVTSSTGFSWATRMTTLTERFWNEAFFLQLKLATATLQVVLTEDARRFADQMGIQLFETSAKDNINVEEMFRSITTLVLKSKKDQKERLDDPSKIDLTKGRHGRPNQKANPKSKCCK